MGKVRLEVLPALAETLGMTETSEEVISELESGVVKSVRDLFNQLAARYQHFGRIVFDSNAQKLNDEVIIFLNGRALELVDGLETQLNDGDTLTFVSPIQGG